MLYCLSITGWEPCFLCDCIARLACQLSQPRYSSTNLFLENAWKFICLRQITFRAGEKLPVGAATCRLAAACCHFEMPSDIICLRECMAGDGEGSLGGAAINGRRVWHCRSSQASCLCMVCRGGEQTNLCVPQFCLISGKMNELANARR